MKHEWRKKEKTLYLPKNQPTILEIPPLTFLTIEGEGNPNSPVFSDCVGALYALSYGIKMSYKGDNQIPGFFDYTVYPLEGVWNLNEEGRKLYQEGTPVIELKDYLTFKVMIRQPDFVTEDVFNQFQQLVYKKKKNDKVLEIKREVINEGMVCQMLHIGSYDDEPASFKLMEEYCETQGYKRLTKEHREIYLSDPSKVAPEKLKTTIRFQVD